MLMQTGRECAFVQDGFHFATQNGQRRTQFMGGISGEAAGLLIGLIEPIQHLVQSLRELIDGIIRMRQR